MFWNILGFGNSASISKLWRRCLTKERRVTCLIRVGKTPPVVGALGKVPAPETPPTQRALGRAPVPEPIPAERALRRIPAREPAPRGIPA